MEPQFILVLGLANFYNFFLLSLSSQRATISFAYRYTFLGLGFFMAVGMDSFEIGCLLFFLFIIGLWIAPGQ